MPQLERDLTFVPQRPVETPSPDPGLSSLPQRAAAQASGEVAEASTKAFLFQAHAQAVLNGTLAAANATEKMRLYAHSIRQGIDPDTGKQIPPEEWSNAYVKKLDQVERDTLKNLSGFPMGGLAATHFINGYRQSRSVLLEHVLTSQDQAIHGKMETQFKTALEENAAAVGRGEKTELEAQHDAQALRDAVPQIQNERTQAEFDKHMDMLPIARDLYLINTGSARQVIDKLFSGQHTYTDTQYQHLMLVANQRLEQQHARWANNRAEEESQQKDNATKLYTQFLQDSLKPGVTPDALEARLLEPGSAEKMSWIGGSFYDNAVTYVHTLRHRALTEGKIITDRNTLVTVETGVYRGTIQNIDDLNRYQGGLSDTDYKNFAHTILSLGTGKARDAYSQGDRDLQRFTNTFSNLMNFDKQAQQYGYDMQHEYNRQTQVLRDKNVFDPNAYADVAQSLVQKYRPLFLSRSITSVGDLRKSLIYQTPQEAATALGGPNTSAYQDWLVRYHQVNDRIEEQARIQLEDSGQAGRKGAGAPAKPSFGAP